MNISPIYPVASGLPPSDTAQRRSSPLGRLLALVCLPLLLLAMPRQVAAQVVTTNHGAGIFKSVVGPDGTSRAHVGDLCTYQIRVTHADGIFVNGVPSAALDSLTITSIVDVIHFNSGDVRMTNYFSLTGTLLTNIFRQPAPPGSFILVSSNFVVPVNVGNVLTNDALTGGYDNHDAAGGTGVRQAFLLTFPAQLSIFKPALCLTKSCVNATGETSLVTFSGTITNCGNTVLNEVYVSNLVNGAYTYILGPTNLSAGQGIAFTGGYTNNNPCAPITDTLWGWGTDPLFLTISNSATATCSNILNPALVVTKACPVTNVAPGQLLRFTGMVSNSGNVTLSNVFIVNDRPVPNTIVALFPTLAPGQVQTFNGSYTAPSNVCSLPDTLTARGTSPCGISVTNMDTKICAISNSPAIMITKICPNGQTLPGNSLTFTGIVQNLGNVALTNVVVLNDRPVPNTVVTNIASLPIGATVIITGSYTVPPTFPDCVIVDTLIARASDICSNTVVSATNSAACLVRGGTLTVTCPTNITVQCLANVPPPNTNSVIVVGSGAINVIFAGDVITTNGCEFVITRTYRANDTCSNMMSCTQVITVRDTTPPTLVGVPVGTNVQCIANLPALPVVTATDNCDTNPTVTRVSTTNGTCPIIIVHTWTATDRCTNIAVASITNTVRDTIPPVLSGVPTNQNFQCLSDVPAPPAVTANDNCDGALPVTITASTNGTCPLTITRMWTATDRCTNSATAIQTITVRDTIPPVLVGVPPGTNVQCLANLPALPVVTATDNCDTNVLVTRVSTTNGTCPIVIVHTWTATDDCTNIAVASITNTVRDTIPPVLSGVPTNQTFQCLTDVPAPPAVTANDNCAGTLPVTLVSVTNGTCPLIITRTWTATDLCTNTASASQTITVRDTIPPVLSGVPTNQNFQCLSDVPTPPIVTANDNCDGLLPVTLVSVTNGTCPILITRTWTASDRCTNTASASQSITVRDTIPPVLSGVPTNQSFQCLANVPPPPAVTATDNCDGVLPVTLVSVTNGTCPLTITRTWTATDRCTNTATAIQNIFVQDTIPPVLVGIPTNQVFECLSSVPPPPAVTATDNCDTNVTITLTSVTNGSCPILITRTWTATDDCTNSTVGIQTIRVQDITPPILIGVLPSTNVQCLADVLPPGTVTAMDNCATNLTVLFSATTNGTCPIIITRTWTVFDACTNSASATRTITVRDTIPPVLVGVPTNQNFQCLSDVPAPPAVTANDNCDGTLPVTLVSVTNGVCPLTITRTWTATDRCTNSAVAVQFITVRDTIPPTLVGVPTNRVLRCPSELTGPATVTATDNCDTNVTINLVCTTNGFRPTVIVWCWQAVDDCNNTTTACQTNTILDLPAALGDFVWDDSNRNGLQDGGEPGISNVTVRLFTCTTALVTTTTTDGNGRYFFNGLIPGSYFIEVDPPAGYMFTTPNAGANDSIDSDVLPASRHSACVPLVCGETNLTVDAGLFRAGCIGDFVWEDLNGNGIQDAGEPGITNVTLRLINCANSNVLATTNTDINGNYLFCDLSPGQYRVEIVVPSGYTITVTNTPPDDCKDSDADPVTRLTDCITLPSGGINLCVDIGLKRPAALGDFVWEDLNFNGRQDAGEPGVANVTVQLYNCNNQLITSQTTDGNGLYLFTNLMPSNYVVRFVLPPGYSFTLPNVGPGDVLDSDAGAGGNSPCTTLMSGETNRTVDAGLVRPVCVGDFVWHDLDGDGIQDPGEPGVSNVVVKLIDCSNSNIVSIGITGTNGYYLLCASNPGNYRVCIVTTNGFNITVPNAGTNDCVDSDADINTGLTDCIFLTGGTTNPCVDIGLKKPAALGDFVWEDLNFNGRQDAGEPGVANVTVQLYNCNNQLITSQTTDGNGLYLFTNLMPSNYVVRFVLPPGYSFTLPNVGPGDVLDSDAGAGGNSPCTTLMSGETNRTVDAGLVRPVCVGDFVWHDLDGDGIQDPGEPGVSNVVVKLIDCSNSNIVSIGITGTNGYYLLCASNPGNYRVCIVTTNGFNITVPNAGTNDCVDSDADINTGLTDCIFLTGGTTNPCVDIGLKKPAALGDFVWEDLNFNGRQDAGEPGVANVTVQLYNCNNQLITSQTTDGNGLYLFTNLMPSNYVVRFVLPPGYSFTLPNVGPGDVLDSDAGAGGNSPCTTLMSGETNRTVDAGLVRPPVCIGVTKLIACYLPGGQCGLFGKTATGIKGGTNLPAFCYNITVTNCGDVALTNLSVIDNKLGDLTTNYFATKLTALPPHQSKTFSFFADWDVDTTNRVDVSGTGTFAAAGSPAETRTAHDEAVAYIDEARVTCTVTLYSPDDQLVDGNTTNDALIKLPNDGFLHPVTVTVMVMNIGDADLANVTLSGSDLVRIGCTNLPAPFPLPAGMAAKVTLCQTLIGCPVPVTNVAVTVNAQVSTNGGLCIYGTNGEPAHVSTSCEGMLMCFSSGNCRVTGGGRQENYFPTDVRYVTHGGQVGAPVGNEGFDPGTCAREGSECIHGNWEHVRHQKGGNRGNFHAKIYDSLMCACLACPQDPNSGFVLGGLCNPGARTCGPEPRKAPANKICFSGIGDYALTSGNREERAVLFRVDIEDRSEPGNSHAGGGQPPPDRHRIRMWILTPAEKARLADCNDRLLDFRRAIAASPSNTPLEDGAVGANGLAVPLGTQVFGVRPPDIDDGGEMDHGNHQIHPSIKDCP